MNKNGTICNNCGKQGHLFHQCKLPITSYGIILFRIVSNESQFLMIRRKNSFGYIDFIRGKYSQYNVSQITSIINEMSLEEKNRIITLSFDDLFCEMWGDVNTQCKGEELTSKKKFESLREGMIIDDVFITLKDIVEATSTTWAETEWEFPKGRRDQKEKDLECALREFEEETGISKHDIVIVDNIFPFEETFIGSNHRPYKHKYFLAFTDKIGDALHNFQKTEVSKIEWKTIENCVESIRPYNLEKKELIININKLLKEYRLYS